MKMTKSDIAGYLGIDYKTLFNWEKNRPNLYKTIMLGLMVEEIIEKSEKNLEELKEIKKEFRKLTKTKGAFPNDNSLLKLLFMGIKNAEKKWTMPVWNWSLTLSQLAICFEGRLDSELKI